jgi:ribosomal protein L7/L12
MPGEYSQLQLSAYIDEMFARFQRIERYLVLIGEKLDLPYEDGSEGVPADVVQLARSGNRMAAVKRYRELTNVSAQEAQDVVTKL